MFLSARSSPTYQCVNHFVCIFVQIVSNFVHIIRGCRINKWYINTHKGQKDTDDYTRNMVTLKAQNLNLLVEFPK